MAGAGGNGLRHIWKFQARNANIRTYGKYLEIPNGNGSLQFWIGIIAECGYMDMYLWFGTQPAQTLRQRLQTHLLEEMERREYFYANLSNGRGLPYILGRYCGCGSTPLNQANMPILEQAIRDAAHNLLDTVCQTVQII